MNNKSYDKIAWLQQTQERLESANQKIEELSRNYHTDPSLLAEVISFGSRFYNYSVRNTQLIYSQNPNACYVQSFAAWKRMGAHIQKGAKALQVLVPVETTLLKDGDHYVRYSDASKELQEAYKNNQIDSLIRKSYKIGNVFDISQTDFPKEKYPEYFSMGYPSELHAQILKGLQDYSLNTLHSAILFDNLNSIALRGLHQVGGNTYLNELLEDTAKLSTAGHELGHAILEHGLTGKISTAEAEFQADAFSIMLDSHFGIEILESRKRHLHNAFLSLEKEWKSSDSYVSLSEEEQEKKISSQLYDTMAVVQGKFKQHIAGIDKAVEPYQTFVQSLPKKQSDFMTQLSKRSGDITLSNSSLEH